MTPIQCVGTTIASPLSYYSHRTIIQSAMHARASDRPSRAAHMLTLALSGAADAVVVRHLNYKSSVAFMCVELKTSSNGAIILFFSVKSDDNDVMPVLSLPATLSRRRHTHTVTCQRAHCVASGNSVNYCRGRIPLAFFSLTHILFRSRHFRLEYDWLRLSAADLSSVQRCKARSRFFSRLCLV